MAYSETHYERNIMDENKKTSKMSTADKIVAASAVTLFASVGVSYGVFVHKQHLASVKNLAEQSKMLAGALDQTIELVAESLKQ